MVMADSLRAQSGGVTLRIDPKGLAWSRSDLADLLLPLIPRLLASPKEPVSVGDLMGLYFTTDRLVRPKALRLRLRLEGSSNWRVLRATGMCGLTPDEKVVASAAFRGCRVPIPMLTEFPTSGCHERVIGGRLYYDSRLASSEAAAALRVLGKTPSKSAYIAQRGNIPVAPGLFPRKEEWARVFDGLGEWCYLVAH